MTNIITRRGRPCRPGPRKSHGETNYHLLREHQLCVLCKTPHDGGWVHCPACRAKRAAQYAARRATQTAQERALAASLPDTLPDDKSPR